MKKQRKKIKAYRNEPVCKPLSSFVEAIHAHTYIDKSIITYIQIKSSHIIIDGCCTLPLKCNGIW